MKAKKIALIVAGLILLVACSAGAATITHEYDELNRLIRTIHPDGTIIEYTYDAAGNRLSAIKSNPSADIPTVQISANPATIQTGQSSTLSWTSTNATSCSIDQGIGSVDCNSSKLVSPSVTTPYEITATGPGGTATSSVTVTVTPAAPLTVSITANPTDIKPGQSSTLSWTSNADTCSIDQAIGSVDCNSSKLVTLDTTTTYTITATRGASTATSNVTVTVTPDPGAPLPTVWISANFTTIVIGASTTLTWGSSNANSCNIQPGIGTVETSGFRNVSPTATTTYTITATGSSGATDTKSVTIIVEGPTVWISADPTTIAIGASTILTWDSTNAIICSIQPPSGCPLYNNTSGSCTVSPLATTTYTITAFGPLGSTAIAKVTVVVGVPVILHKDGALWSLDTGWTTTTSPYYPGSAYAVDIEYRADGSYVILHKDGAVWDSVSGWNMAAPPYYPGTGYASDLERFPNMFTSSYTILHRDGALWNSLTGWILTTPPYYPESGYAVDLEYRSNTSYLILHKDGAVYDSASGWKAESPPYYPGTVWAKDLELRSNGTAYVILHQDGALWSTDGGWIMDSPPYYPGTGYAVDLELKADGVYAILHKDGAIWNSDTGWNMATPPYYPGDAYAVDLELK